MAESSATIPARTGLNPARWLVPAAAVFAALFFFNPEHHDFYPVCYFHKLTGWNCPLCGSTRAAYALVHGQFAAAFHDNALFVISLPFLAVYFIRKSFFRRASSPTETPKTGRNWQWIAILTVLILFGVLRNLPYPAFRWMSP